MKVTAITVNLNRVGFVSSLLNHPSGVVRDSKNGMTPKNPSVTKGKREESKRAPPTPSSGVVYVTQIPRL